MQIGLLHYSFWPEAGGVEQVMRDQANMLRRAGHDVTVFAGRGADPGDGYRVRILPEIAPDFALQKQVNAVLERGQADQNFSKYRATLGEALRRELDGIELTLVHNVFTMHPNLALTLALHDLAAEQRCVAWTHDLVAGNPSYALPNPTQPPWNLMRTSHPGVIYVAVSERVAEQAGAQLTPLVKPHVIPNLLDPVRLFGLTPELRASYAGLELAARDFVFLLPAAVTPQGNMEFALDVVRQLCGQERDPLLLITAPAVRQASAAAYGAFVRQSLVSELSNHVVFVSDFFPVSDAALRDLYLLADCLLLPSKQKSFGLPIVEAAAYRLPIWCQDVPAFQPLADLAFLLDDLSKVDAAVEWLEGQPTFRAQRRCRALFNPALIYQNYYEPLFALAGVEPA